MVPWSRWPVGDRTIMNDVLDQQITFNWKTNAEAQSRQKNFSFKCIMVVTTHTLTTVSMPIIYWLIYPFCSWVWIHICTRRRWEHVYAAHRQASSQERHHTSWNQTHWTPRYLQPWLHSFSTCTLASPPSLTPTPLPPSLPPSSFPPPFLPLSLSLL